MRVSTFTLNPAIDKTYYADDFALDKVNRAEKTKTNAGGKGINFTAALAECSVPLLALGFLGTGGNMIDAFLKAKNVETDFVRTEGEIRTNIKICDLKRGTYTDLNEGGAPVSKDEMIRLFEKAEEAAKKSGIVYMGGSLPMGAGDDTYAKIIKLCKACGALSAADTSGAALKCAIAEKPDIIKPNEKEAEELLGEPITSVSDAAKAAKKLFSLGIKNVLLSLGGEGAVCAGEDGVYRVCPLPVSVKSTVGAGDSFLAGFVYGKTRGASFEECIKYAASFSAAKIEKDGTDIPAFDDLTKYVNSVKLENLV
ncbi:MAG: 1-phosphofructokinase [Clostridia bacterium]|nr:1-phosphofructokinase [Clostridia bacterium]